MAHNILHDVLLKWVKHIEFGILDIDLRTQLHLTAWTKLSALLSTSAKRRAETYPLTKDAKLNPNSIEKQQLRSFSANKKLAVVMEAEQPGTSVARVARVNGNVESMLFRWCAELGFGKSTCIKFAGVAVDNPTHGHSAPTVVRPNILPMSDGMNTVELSDGQMSTYPKAVMLKMRDGMQRPWQKRDADHSCRCQNPRLFEQDVPV
jgi:hypothetical protein